MARTHVSGSRDAEGMSATSLPQHKMIESFRKACATDHRVAAALMYGSFATGEADAFSDIEFAVFIQDGALDDFDQRTFLNTISPLAAYFPDDFGHHTALFENGVRGEFHFMRESDVPVVATWQGYGWYPSLSAAVVLDRSGDLSRHAKALVGGPPARGGAPLVERLALNLLSLMQFGAGLLNRGEYARAWRLLGEAHVHLLKLVRLRIGVTDHWPTPSRALERDLPASEYDRYVACTASAEPQALSTAYGETWKWALELSENLARPLGIELPAATVNEVNRLLDEAAVRLSQGG